MSNFNVSSFRTASVGGHVLIGKGNDDSATVVSSQKKLGGRLLDWMAAGALKNTNWGSGRLSQMRSEEKIAFNTFVGALKKEYGVKSGNADDVLKSNIGKAIHEAFGKEVPRLNAKNIARMETIAKNFRGAGNAKVLQRNLVVRWWESKGLSHPGHAAAGIRNRMQDPKAGDKYVSFWPGDSAGGKGEIFGKAQEGSLSNDVKNDYGAELSDRTGDRLETSRMARKELMPFEGKANTFFSDLRGIDKDMRSEQASPRLKSAVKDLTKGIQVKFDKEGEVTPDQSLAGEMKIRMGDLVEGYVSGDVSLEDCIKGLKEACNTYTSELAGMSKFEPQARQKRFGEGKDANWGVKAEKFFLPLAGQNQVKGKGKEFTYFGLNESKMTERHDELTEAYKTADPRGFMLNLTVDEIEGDWNEKKIGYLSKQTTELRDSYEPESNEYKAIDECLTNAKFDSLEGCQQFVKDLQKVLNGHDHALPYKMVSKEDNCAGYITKLMDLGGAGAFASKPRVNVATSPNDTAAWAKKVLVEVDRLNVAAKDILSKLDPNLELKPRDIEQCPKEVRVAYQSLMEMENLDSIPHGDLMKKVKTLVEAISSAKDLPGDVGAALLNNIQPLYAKAGNPVI